MTFIFALFLVPAVFIANNLYGHDGITAVLIGAPFVVPALALLEGLLKGIAMLFRNRT
ncbi:hypothetical protein [Sneathiella aquimaris]|uniref:hypothetical protein n=1 Tax=Sneathiella aquimaris TaxID=2599305 RepID=UPI00146A92D1|nr:hypothetical protein [Sneathiella aquimaris]